MIIDFHTHCYREDIAKRAISIVPEGSSFGPFYDGTCLGLISLMNKCGIDRSVVLNIANKPSSTKDVNDFAISLITNNRLISFGSVHPYCANYLDELKRLKDYGILGIKFQPYYQKFDVLDKEAYKVYEAAANMGFIMVFHCGSDILIEGDYCVPKKFAKLAGDFKGAKIVGAHLGGLNCVKDALNYVIGKDVYIDISFTLRQMSEEERNELFLRHNSNKILFGSDTPWADPSKDVEFIKSHILDSKLKNKIFYKNALSLLGENE